MKPIKPGEIITFDINILREFIHRCEWKWAKSMVNVPHEYIYRGRCPLTDDEYYYFLKAQVYCGKKEWYGRKLNSYLYIDGYKYWTMGEYVADNNTMNRQKVFGEYDNLLDPFPEYYSEQDLKCVANAIRQFNLSVFDAGCGDGRIFKHLGLSPQRYYGIDPSKRCVAQLRENNPGMFQRVSTRPFEEMTDRWQSTECVVVATFGSASYFMTQYLELLAKSNKPHFLMFFKNGFLPTVLGETHIFNRSTEQLKRLFPFSVVVERGDYTIVSSKEIDWNKANGATLIQPSLFD